MDQTVKKPAGVSPQVSRKPSPRVLLLVGVLGIAIAAYFLTAGMRAKLAERAWFDKLAVIRAQQIQDQERDRRKLRADLRDALKALGKNPEDFQALLKAASVYGQLQQYPHALFLLREAARLQPRSLEVFRAKSQVYFSIGAYDRAMEVTAQGLKLAPDDLELSLTRLDVEAALGQAGQARVEVKRLLAAHPKEARAHMMAALLARQVADAKGATAELKEAQRLDPRNDRICGVLAVMQWELGQRKEALENVHRALEINPKDSGYYLQLADMTRLDSGSNPEGLREAVRVYRRVLELDPQAEQAKFGIAQCLIAMKDPDGQKILEEVVRNNPGLAAPLLELGNLYQKLGRREEAQGVSGRDAPRGRAEGPDPPLRDAAGRSPGAAGNGELLPRERDAPEGGRGPAAGTPRAARGQQPASAAGPRP
jgi:tetratricopeptide (TPR) repeat protein